MIEFDEGTALMDVLDMIKTKLSQAERDFDHATERIYAITSDPNANAAQIQEAIEWQICTRARYDAIERINYQAQCIYNNMICEAAGLPYFN